MIGKKSQNLLKNFVAGFIAVALLVSGAFLFGTSSDLVVASDSVATKVTKNTDGYHVKSYKADDFAAFRGETYTYPKLTAADGSDYQEWLFAGWFTDDTCATAIDSSATSVSGTVYAKFVDADLSYIKCQVTPGTDKDSELAHMRLISTVESTDYSGTGFYVTYKGGTPRRCPAETVYKRLSATEDGMECGYSPIAFNEDAEYLSAIRLTGIGSANFDEPFYIQSYWETLDGTEVRGMSRYARIEDSYEKIVNVPVRLYASDVEATSGSVSVTYDANQFSLYTTDEYNGYDGGKGFTVTNVDSTTTSGKITVTGTADNGVAEGLFVNLRLQLKDGATIESNTTFTVADETFVNGEAAVTGLDVSNVIFKNYPVAYNGNVDTSWYDDFEDNKTFVISSAADLHGLAKIVNDTTGIYKDEFFSGDTIKLGSDITVNEGEPSEDDWATTGPEHEWTSIGKSTAFAGTFDGQGNAIKGIYTSATDGYVGLFGQVTTGGSVVNLELHNSYLAGSGNYVGSIVGYSKGNIDTVYSTAYVVNTGGHTGGIVGQIADPNEKDTAQEALDINKCWFGGSLTTGGAGGGIIGSTARGDYNITNCLNTGTIITTHTGNQYVGGILGTDNVAASTGYTNEIAISNCLNVGQMTPAGTNYIGSLVGRLKNATSTYTFGNSYATTESYSVDDAAKLFGGTTGTIADGSVYGNVAQATVNGYTSYDAIKFSNYATRSNPEGTWVVRESADDVAGGSPALRAFVDEWIDVAWYYDTEKSADEGETYNIGTAEELYGFSAISQGYNFSGDTVTLNPESGVIEVNKGVASENGWMPDADNGTSRTWTPIGGGKTFAGTFNGSDCVIRGVYANMPTTTYAGLFAQASGTIQNLKLENSYIYSDKQLVGTVVGFLSGDMSGVYSNSHVVTTPNASANNETGGLVGRYGGTGTKTLSKCWFAGTVTASTQYSGGIVGRVNMGTKTIQNCLNSGTINSSCDENAYVGGITGGVNGGSNMKSCTISDCLDVGMIRTDATTGVGSVIGTMNKQTTIKDTYSTTITSDAGWDTTDTVAGIGNGAITATTLTGIPREFDAENIEGAKAYFNTDLEFKTSSSDGAWIAIEGSTPELAKFSEKTPINDFGTDQRIAYGWYYNGFVHSAGARATSETYTIMDKDDLFGLAKVVNGEADVTADTFDNDTVVLGASITVSDGQATDWEKGENIPNNPWTPIGNKNTKFVGTFDGNQKSIKGLYMNMKTNYPALFGHAEGCTIHDLRLENSYLKTTYDTTANLGSIIGYGYGTLENVYSDAILHSSGRRTGGLIGTVIGKTDLTSCWFDGKINIEYSGSDRLESGGIVGLVTGKTQTTMDTCLYSGDMYLDLSDKAEDRGTYGIAVGGICGYNDTNANVSINNSIAAGTIDVARKDATADSVTANISRLCSVLGRSVTQANNSATNVYGITKITYKAEATASAKTVTKAGDNVSTSFKVESKWTGDEEHLFGLGAQLLTELSFTEEHRKAADTAIKGEEVTVAGAIWAARRGQIPAPAALVADSDKLSVGDLGKADTSWLTDGSGNGYLETPYIIKDVEDLYGFAKESKTNNFAGMYIKLSDDIDVIDVNPGEFAEDWAEGTAALLPWYSIGVAEDGLRFAGHFDGNGKTISGIYMNQDSSYLGLFAATESGSTITNLRLTNSYINYTGNGTANTGSIVGDLRGDMTEVYSDAIIHSNGENTGGLVALVNETSAEEADAVHITNCWYDGQLTSSKRYVGGLAAKVEQGSVNIENSLNTGKIKNDYSSGHAFVGGFCGRVSGQSEVDITDCIAAGEITDACGGRSVRSVVGDVQGSTVNFENMFATKGAFGRALPNTNSQKVTVTKVDESTGEDVENTVTYSGVYNGTIIRTHKADRLIGYCIEEVEDGEIAPSLDFTSDWTIRTSDVPVPTCFANLDTSVTVADGSTLDATLNAQIGLDSLGLSVANAVNMGEGNYVLNATVDDTAYNSYIETLENTLGFGEPVAENSTGAGADGVHSVSYKKQNPVWVLTLTYVETTKALTISINTDPDSLSDNLVYNSDVVDENYSASGDVTLSMLQLNASTDAYSDLSTYENAESYYYGNSFVFQLPNGHFIINDGGEKEEFGKLAAHLQGKAAEAGLDKVYVDAWVVSHQHGDHFDIIKAVVDAVSSPAEDTSKQVLDAKNKIYVDAFYLSEPNSKTLALGSDLNGDVDKLYYGMTLFTKENGEQSDIYRMHTGQRYFFHGLTMDVIQAQEQIPYSEYAKTSAGMEEKDFNTASTVVLFTTSNNQKIFIGGDANYVNMQYIMDSYGENPTTLSNIDVFVALHHGKNTSMKLDAQYDREGKLGIFGIPEPDPDNSFTNYLIKNSKNTEQQFDVVLFPCSVIYDVNAEGENVDALHDVSYAFPQAGEANVYLLGFAKNKQYYHYGNGTKEVTLSSTGISIQ